MRSVLDAPWQRQIQIIEILTKAEGWVTVSSLSKNLGVATKTINDDINVIREAWGAELNIESSFVYGIRINQASSSILLMIFSDLFNDSLSVKWIELVFYTPYKDIKYYAEKLHVSQSTLYRLRTKINNFFETYGICLNSRKSVYYFTADNEIVFRKILTTILTEVSGGFLLKVIEKKILISLQKRISEGILKKYVEKYNLNSYYFAIFYYVSLVRENQGFSKEKRMVNEINVIPPSSVYLLSVQNDFPRVKEEQIINIEEDIMFHLEGWNSNEERKLTNKRINEFVKHLFKVLNLNYTVEQFKVFELGLNILYLEQTNFDIPILKLFNRISYFALKFKKEMPGLYKCLESQFRQLSNESDIKLIGYIDIVIYFLVTTIPEILMCNNVKKVLVISDVSKKHAHFIVERLSYNVTRKECSNELFEPVTKTEVTMLDMENYQFIVSNCLVNGQGLEVVLIDDYPSYKDIFQVNHQINLHFK